MSVRAWLAAMLAVCLCLPAAAKQRRQCSSGPASPEISSSRWATMMIAADGSSWSCGYFHFYFTYDLPIQWYPVQFTAPGTTSSVSSGKYHAFVDDRGFGANDYGDLGLDPTFDVNDWIDVPTNVPPVTGAAVAGYEASFFVSGGRVFAAGRNEQGELGRGGFDLDDHFTFEPVQRLGAGGVLEDLTGAAQVVAGAGWAAALMSDGTVWTWGSNAFGQLGDGTTTDRAYAAPVSFPGGALLTNVVQISASPERGPLGLESNPTHGHALAVDAAGQVWGWGENRDGELASGEVWMPTGSETFNPFFSTLPQTFPVLALRDDGQPLANVVQVAAGGGHSLALQNDGTVWTSGYNGTGQLGNGVDLDDRGTGFASPVIATPFHGAVRSVAAGPGTSFAVDAAGVVWSWGFKYNGGLCQGAAFEDPDPNVISGRLPVNFVDRPTAVLTGEGGPEFSLGVRVTSGGCGGRPRGGDHDHDHGHGYGHGHDRERGHDRHDDAEREHRR